jgi:hypothetical protein
MQKVVTEFFLLNLFFVGILKANDENRSESGSTPKWHGSATQVKTYLTMHTTGQGVTCWAAKIPRI